MKKPIQLLLACALALPALSAAHASEAPTDRALLRQAAALGCQQAGCTSSDVQRRDLGGGVAEYTYVLRLGTGTYDAIGLHRIVREQSPFHPVHTNRALLLMHGDIWGFEAAFLSDPSHSLPVFLAKNNLDVWGIDLRWVRVPATVTDFTFMKDWGIEHDVQDVEVALTVARAVRFATGNGLGRMALLGWSRGGIIGYAVVNGETGVPAAFRNVGAFIPVDIYLKTDDAGFRQNACNRYAAEKALIDAGTYQATSGTAVQALGNLAVADPAGSSPIFPGLTNNQAGLLAGEATFVFFAPDQQPVPSYHFTGGTFAAPLPSGIPVPTGLSYSSKPVWFRELQGASPFQPERELADSDAAICGTPDVPFDDHLAQITVPVLYIGAGGGFGPYGVYTTTLLGSHDVTTHIVHLTPDSNRLGDFGHADLFIGTNAQTLVWQTILNWVRTH